ncbi:hypothetical protein J3458_001321 [Metarhizium acridum]|uniref:uncharacterized protein n=1 Tax=Metarhizium acridum TaxID=92637 RepID=UPI001C6CD6E8|nr:hypothetical protein J3458_001321 [Metarhizium acridum]
MIRHLYSAFKGLFRIALQRACAYLPTLFIRDIQSRTSIAGSSTLFCREDSLPKHDGQPQPNRAAVTLDAPLHLDQSVQRYSVPTSQFSPLVIVGVNIPIPARTGRYTQGYEEEGKLSRSLSTE